MRTLHVAVQAVLARRWDLSCRLHARKESDCNMNRKHIPPKKGNGELGVLREKKDDQCGWGRVRERRWEWWVHLSFLELESWSTAERRGLKMTEVYHLQFWRLEVKTLRFQLGPDNCKEDHSLPALSCWHGRGCSALLRAWQMHHPGLRLCSQEAVFSLGVPVSLLFL